MDFKKSGNVTIILIRGKDDSFKNNGLIRTIKRKHLDGYDGEIFVNVLDLPEVFETLEGLKNLLLEYNKKEGEFLLCFVRKEIKEEISVQAVKLAIETGITFCLISENDCGWRLDRFGGKREVVKMTNYGNYNNGMPVIRLLGTPNDN